MAVQPFVFVKSAPTVDGTAGGVPFGAVTNINNVSWGTTEIHHQRGQFATFGLDRQFERLQLGLFRQRTKDSGSRMSCLREMGYTYNQGVTTYIFSFTNGFWYKAANNNTTFGAVGESNAVFQVGIVGSGAAAAANAANLGWGPGYIGGGDIKTDLVITPTPTRRFPTYQFLTPRASLRPIGRKSSPLAGFGRRRLVPAFVVRPLPTTTRPSFGVIIHSGIMKS